MNDNKTLEQSKYEDFIFNNQFQRKIPMYQYMFSKKAIILITTAVVILLIDANSRYMQISFIAIIAFVLYSYYNTTLTYESSINTIPYDGMDDIKTGAILLYSKYIWAKRRIARKQNAHI